MANRDFDPDVPTVNVVPKEPSNLLLGIAAIGEQAAEASENSKLLMYGAQAHAQFKAVDAQYRQQFADNPNAPEATKWLQDQRQQISDKLGGQLSPLYQRQWQSKVTELGAQSDVSNEMWGFHQNYRNAVNNTNVAYKTYLDVGNQDGKAYGVSDATDGGNIMNFLGARQTITDHSVPFIGADKTNELVKNFDADYVKSFVAGVAETSPQKALGLLNMPEIQQHFTTMDRDDMLQVVKRTAKAQQMMQSMSVTTNDGQLNDLVNDTQTTYYEKRAKIDQLDLAGAISPTAAGKARRVIKSSSDLDAQTDTPVMASLVNQIYDLNANASTNGEDYLRGVRNVQEQILDMQAEGKLTAPDAGKMQNQVRTLTSAKLASATQSVGLQFYDANQKFNILPPEFRGDATRQLFYASDGKNFSPQQFVATAQGIIDGINQKRRAAAQDAIKQVSQTDAQMLQELKATPADIEETAKKYHISTDEVIRQLRQKRLNKGAPARAGRQTRSTGGEEDLPAASSGSPAAPVSDEPPINPDNEGAEQ